MSLLGFDSAGASIDSSFGHLHNTGAAKPIGALSNTSPNTGATGTAVVTYRPSQVSSPILIVAASAAADTARDTLYVGVPFLISLEQRASDSLIGQIASTRPGHHISNHWVIGAVATRINSVSDSLHAQFPEYKPHWNDGSLRWGGKFDVGSNVWVGSHVEHMMGRDVDLRTDHSPGITNDTIRKMIKYFWQELGGTVYDERNKPDVPPHFHLRYRKPEVE